MLQVNLLLRFRTFFQSLLSSPSPEVQVTARLAARDLQSSVGSNLALLQEESGSLDPWTVSPGQLRAALLWTEAEPVREEDSWRIPCLHRLLTEQLLHHNSGNKEGGGAGHGNCK